MSSRQRDGETTPAGSRGSATRVKTSSDGEAFEAAKNTEHVAPGAPYPKGMALASVGFSASVGQSTQFAREKVEVSAWCTLPCPPTVSAMGQAYEECKTWVFNELEVRSAEAVERFFPNMIKDND